MNKGSVCLCMVGGGGGMGGGCEACFTSKLWGWFYFFFLVELVINSLSKKLYNYNVDHLNL